MQIFVTSVNPLLQLLDTKLKGVTLYSMPVSGPLQEDQAPLPLLSHTEKQINYVDDLNPIVTSREEFYLLD